MNAKYLLGDTVTGMARRPTAFGSAASRFGEQHRACGREIMRLNNENVRLADELARERARNEDTGEAVRLRRTRSARAVEHPKGVTVYPEPHAAPVLPPGWPPLDPQDEASVLRACDAAPGACRLRLRSLWDAASEYRVYCLDDEAWRGVCAATVFAPDAAGTSGEGAAGRNTRLLAVGHTPHDAARVALDFLNWDLEADGSDWRLTLTPAP
jgi:hypothetical protein